MSTKGDSKKSLILAHEISGAKTFSLPSFGDTQHLVERDADDRPKSAVALRNKGASAPKAKSEREGPAERHAKGQGVSKATMPEFMGAEKDNGAAIAMKPSASKKNANSQSSKSNKNTEQGSVSSSSEEELIGIREQAYATAYAEGHQAGLSAGHEEGLNKGKEEGLEQALIDAQASVKAELEPLVQERCQRLEQLIGHLFNPVATQDEQVTMLLADMSRFIAEQVIQRELKIDSSQIVDITRDAVLALPVGAENIRVYLNPQDLDEIKELKLQFQADWQLIPDPKLSAGGCRIETLHSLVDASVENRLKLILEQISEQHLHTHAQTLQAAQPKAEPE